LIDWLKGLPWAKRLVWSGDSSLYCSSVTRKELFSKPGLSDSERKRIVRLLHHIRVLEVDAVIAAAASELLQKYTHTPLQVYDALVAATAWTKRLPLINTMPLSRKSNWCPLKIWFENNAATLQDIYASRKSKAEPPALGWY